MTGLCGNWTVGCSWERWGHSRKGGTKDPGSVAPLRVLCTLLLPHQALPAAGYLLLCCENGDFREFLPPGTQPEDCRGAFQSWPHPFSGYREHFKDQQAKACPLSEFRDIGISPPPQRNPVSAHVPLLHERWNCSPVRTSPGSSYPVLCRVALSGAESAFGAPSRSTS